MKIAVSPTFESDDDIKKFMEKVVADVSCLSRHDVVANIVSPLVQVLKLTKTIIDQLSQVRH